MKEVGFPHSLASKESACNAGDLGSIPRLGRSPGEGNGNPLQYSHLQNPVDRGAWQATVHGITRVGHDLVTKPPPPWSCYDCCVSQERGCVMAAMLCLQFLQLLKSPSSLLACVLPTMGSANSAHSEIQ